VSADPGPAQGPGQEPRVAAGQVDQAGPGDQRGQVLGSGFVAIPDHYRHLFHPEPFGLSRAQAEPVPQPLLALGRGRGGELHVTGRTARDQRALDLRHDRQVLAAAHERERSRSLWLHGLTLALI
jgi:hypothetical protein